MMDWTDTHCRYFHRLLTRHTRLYTEMVTTGALLPFSPLLLLAGVLVWRSRRRSAAPASA